MVNPDQPDAVVAALERPDDPVVAVGGVPVGVSSAMMLGSAAVSSSPGGKVMCDTVPLASAWPMPMSTTAGTCRGTSTLTL